MKEIVYELNFYIVNNLAYTIYPTIIYVLRTDFNIFTINTELSAPSSTFNIDVY